MRYYQIMMAYNALGRASLTNLDINDVKVILDFRKKAMPHINAFQEAQKDALEQLKPDIKEGMPKEEVEKLNKEYERRVNEALNEDFNKEIDLGLVDKKTSPDAEALILQNSKLTINDIELFRFLLG